MSETLLSLSSNGFVDIPDADLHLLQTLFRTTRCCPRCCVIIEKKEGCDSFGCICGHRFNFAEAPRFFGQGIRSFDHIGCAYQYGEPSESFVAHCGTMRAMCSEFCSAKPVIELAMRARANLKQAFSYYAAWTSAGLPHRTYRHRELFTMLLARNLHPHTFFQRHQQQKRFLKTIGCLTKVQALAEKYRVYHLE